MVAESLEQARKNNIDITNSAKESEKKLKLGLEFENRPEIIGLGNTLDDVVNPREKEKILLRLSVRYIKDPEIFVLEQALREVILGGNIYGVGSSGILLENEEGKTLTRDEKKEILEELFPKVEGDPWGEITTFTSDVLNPRDETNTSPNTRKETGNKNNEKKQDPFNSPENKEKMDVLENSPYYPILQGLYKSHKIDEKKVTEALHYLTLPSITKEDGNEIMKKLVKTIPHGDETQENIFNFLNGKSEKKEFTPEDLSNIGIDIEKPSGVDTLLAQNYFSIPDKNGNTNAKEDFSRSVNITLNKIIVNQGVDFPKLKNNAKLIAEIRKISKQGEITADDCQSLYKKIKTLHQENKKDAPKFYKGGKVNKENEQDKAPHYDKNMVITTNQGETSTSMGKIETGAQIERNVFKKKGSIDITADNIVLAESNDRTFSQAA